MFGIIVGATVGVITGDVRLNLDFASVNECSATWVDVSVGSCRGLDALNPVLSPDKSEGVKFNPPAGGGVDVITVAGACSCLFLNRPCPPPSKSSANNPPACAVGLAGGAVGGAVGGAIGLKRPVPVDISAKNPLAGGCCVKMLVAGGVGCVKMLVAGGVGCDKIFIAGWVDVADCGIEVGMGCPNICAENNVNGCGGVALEGNIFIGACNALDDGIAGVNVRGDDGGV